MPTYQYRCPACGNEFEKFQRISDEPLKNCPECGANPERIITGGAGFLLKGTGFYTTDYRSESYKKEAKKEEAVPKPKETKDTSKNTAKETKAEKKE